MRRAGGAGGRSWSYFWDLAVVKESQAMFCAVTIVKESQAMF